jgi:hypothetical protein
MVVAEQRGRRPLLSGLILGGTLFVGCSSASPPSTSDAAIGVVAPTAPAANLPFTIVVSPQTANAGETIHVGFEGDLSGEWLYGAGATLDLAVGDQWRTVWALINDSFAVPPISMTSEVTATSVPGIGYELSTDSNFALPAALAPGKYHFCQTVARSESSAGGSASARLCAELTVP